MGDISIRLSIIHGDLRYAQYPIAVGHYLHDVIVNAEAALDGALGGALRHRFDLGVYPGPIESSEVIRGATRPPGAIVIGLGDIGELTSEQLRRTFASAIRKYALQVAEEPALPNETLPRSAGFSSLLVGTDGGGVGALPDCILAIVRGALDANRSLREFGLLDRVVVDHIEFVEVYEDVAIRAAHVLSDIPMLMAHQLKEGERITTPERSEDEEDGEPILRTVPGARFLRPPDPYSSGWWQRIGVRQKRAEDEGQSAETTTALQFSVLTDRARLEQETSLGQRALLTQLLTNATSQPLADLELSTALYRLIVPEPIRDRINRGGDLVFVVDRGGAAYPFELMAEKTADTSRALAEGRGILRQFEAGIYRPRPEMARENRMLIVGNPKTILWADLPGAEKEAEEVEEVATKFSIEVVRPLPDQATEMVIKLIAQEFRILHFAAHGQFDPDPMKSGVVISDRLFITPAEIERLARVPEFVFLNCCYLGVMSGARATTPDPRLAAGLAEGFIRAGVRAVIAAGWAVADEAGRVFACTFYEHFLAGKTFGESVREARDRTRAQFPTLNTWGAFQCYGNPDYRFRVVRDGARSGAARPFVAPSEALQALRTLASNARCMRLEDLPWFEQEFTALSTAIKPWHKRGELLAASGEIYGELERFEPAVTTYKESLAANPATASILVVEQLANLLARSAGDDPATAPAALEEAVKWLDWLDQRIAATAERHAIRGSAYKRWARVSSGEDRRRYVALAAESYRLGAELSKKGQGYQRQNALALQFVRGTEPIDALRQIADDAYLELRRRSSVRRHLAFWDIVALPDALLFKHLVHQSLGDAAVKDEITMLYEQARAAGPSPREWASVRDHIVFLADMTADRMLPCYDPASSSTLREILSAAFGVAGAGA